MTPKAMTDTQKSMRSSGGSGESGRIAAALPGLVVRRVSEAAGVFTRPGFVDLEGLAVHIAAVETGDRGFRLVVGAELDEAEALRLAAATLGGDVRRNRLSVRCGELVELCVRDLFGEISHVEFHLMLLRRY